MCYVSVVASKLFWSVASPNPFMPGSVPFCVHILGSGEKTQAVDQRIWGSILCIKLRKRQLRRCRRALQCELPYGTVKSCNEAAKAA